MRIEDGKIGTAQQAVVAVGGSDAVQRPADVRFGQHLVCIVIDVIANGSAVGDGDLPALKGSVNNNRILA